MSTEKKKDQIYNRINYWMDRYSRVFPIYNFLNEKLFLKFHRITDSDYTELEQRLEKVESILNNDNPNEFKINELRQMNN